MRLSALQKTLIDRLLASGLDECYWIECDDQPKIYIKYGMNPGLINFSNSEYLTYPTLDIFIKTEMTRNALKICKSLECKWARF